MKHALLIAVLLIGLDQTLGFVLDRLYSHTTTGATGGNINGILRQNVDVLVLGSSRARHHVVSAILRDKLSMSVFNAGLDGHEFLSATMLFDLWIHSHPPPKVILLHIDPVSLLYSKRELARTSSFSGHFRESEQVRSVLLMRGKYEWIKYLSSSYRFNGKVLSIIKNLAMSPDALSDGYIGLNGSHQSEAAQAADPTDNMTHYYSDPFWDVKLNYLAKIAQYCNANGTRLILFHSPHPQEDRAALAAWSKHLAALQFSYEGVEFLDLAAHADGLVAGRPDLFWDKAHLNSRGAEIFSALLAGEVSNRLGLIDAMKQ